MNKQTIKPSVGFKHSPSFFGFSHRKKNPLEKEEYQNVELDDGTCPNEEIKPKTQSLKIQTGRMNTITGQDVEERKNSNDDCLINLYNPVSTKGQWNKFRLLKSIDKDKVTNIRMYTDDEKRIPVLAATKITKRSYDLFSVTDGIEIKVGILKWNFFGTEFNIYNTGQKPKSGITDNLRANLGAITYVNISL